MSEICKFFYSFLHNNKRTVPLLARGGWVEDKLENYHAYCAYAVRVNNLGNILHPPLPIQMDSGQ